MSQTIRDFLFNQIFISTVLSMCLAQLLKGFLYIIIRKRKKTKELIEIITWRTGGMPSSHAAIVCSLTASVGLVEGIASTFFMITFWFALVVLRDAMGVRRSAGLVAKALNNLGKQAAEKTGIDFSPVKEIQGHTPLEVIVGGFLGVFISTCVHLL